MGVLSPISAVLGAAIPVVIGLFRGERPGALAYVGMALAVVAARGQASSEHKEFATSLTPGKAATDSPSSNMYVGTPGTSSMWIQVQAFTIRADFLAKQADLILFSGEERVLAGCKGTLDFT